jgi:hypothetical protein
VWREREREGEREREREREREKEMVEITHLFYSDVCIHVCQFALCSRDDKRKIHRREERK